MFFFCQKKKKNHPIVVAECSFFFIGNHFISDRVVLCKLSHLCFEEQYIHGQNKNEGTLHQGQDSPPP